MNIPANVRAMSRNLTGISAIAAALVAVALPATAAAAPIAISTTDKIVIQHLNGENPSTCTLGFVFTGTDGEPRALTAGHCGSEGDLVQTADHRTIGRIAVSRFSGTFNSVDTALISFTPGSVAVDPHIPGVGGVSGVAGRSEVERANPVACKLGPTSGLSCGPMTVVKTPVPMLAFRMASDHGDSGAPVWMYCADGRILAVGTVSADGSLDGGPGRDAGVTYVEPIEKYVAEWELH